MVEIIIQHKPSNEITQIVAELKSLGYKVGIDFDFEYSSGRFDWNTQIDVPRQTKFTFYNEPIGSWFTLKYS